MSCYRVTMLHIFMIVLLLYLFGYFVYSGSVDLTHHYILIDFLLNHPIETLRTDDAVASMSHYPPGAHWMAVAVAYITDAPFAAMILIGIAATYIGYYALCRLACEGSGLVAAAMLVVSVILLRNWMVPFGNEIIYNYFYSQIVGTALLFVTILACLSFNKDWQLSVFAVIAGFATLSVHLLPALNIFGTATLYLFVRAVLPGKQGVLKRLALPALFAVTGSLVVLSHPTLANMRFLATNDGALGFTIDYPWIMAASAAGVILALAFLVLKFRTDIPRAIIMIASLAIASISLMAAQYLALHLAGDGSTYAVKKHLFIVSVAAVLLLSVALAAFVPVSATRFAGRLLSAVCAAFLSWSLFAPVLPAFSTQDVERTIHYAGSAIEVDVPGFRPGNTAVLAASVPPMIRYMISTAVFRMPFGPSTVALALDTFDTRNAQFAMIDTAEIPDNCNERYASSSRFTVVRSDCLTNVKPGEMISFANHGHIRFLKAGGWWPAEDWGTWTKGEDSRLSMVIDAASDADLVARFELFPFLPAGRAAQSGTIVVNGIGHEFRLTDVSPFSFAIPAGTIRDGKIDMLIQTDDATSPYAAGMSSDGRTLGVGVKSLVLEPVR